MSRSNVFTDERMLDLLVRTLFSDHFYAYVSVLNSVTIYQTQHITSYIVILYCYFEFSTAL